MNFIEKSCIVPIGKDNNCTVEVVVLNPNHSGIPIVIAPGFFTEDTDEWKSYISQRINSPIYYVRWSSSSLYRTLKSAMFYMPSIAVMPNVFFSSKILLAARSAKGSAILIKLFSSWIISSRRANQVGLDLAIFLNNIWDKDTKAIFIGHSLGVRIITNAMQNLAHDHVLTSISIAGAINKDEYDQRIAKIRTKRKITHINFLSTNDKVLTWLYKFGELKLKPNPIGLNLSLIENTRNITTNIGHTEYHASQFFSGALSTIFKEFSTEHTKNIPS